MLVLGLRWRAATRPRRRALLPTIAGSFVLLIYSALLINDLVSGERSEPLLWIASCSLVTVPLAFLAGLLRSRLARSGLADLFRDLRNLDHDALQATLARALGDPGLRLAYAGADGTLPVPDERRSVAPLERDGRRFAALVYDPSLDDDPELVEAVSAAAAIALENEQLHAESQERLAELMASRERIVAAGDAERRRLERNLHDGAQQRLVALAMQLRLIQADIRSDPAAAEARVSTASDELAESLGELRELARGHPPGGARVRTPHGARVARGTLAGADRGVVGRRPTGSRRRSSSRPTSWPASHSPTSPSTRTRTPPRCTSRQRQLLPRLWQESVLLKAEASDPPASFKLLIAAALASRREALHLRCESRDHRC